MSETVKVIYDGVNRLGIAIRPKETIYFVPGLNEIPAADWKEMTERSRKNPRKGEAELLADDPGGLNHHLKGGKLRLANPDVQEVEDVGDVALMEWRSANQVINETMSLEAVKRMEESERKRKRGPRDSVMKSIKEKIGLLETLNAPPKDETA